MTNQTSVQNQTEGRRLLYSMKSLSNLLGCSTVTCQTIKNSGKIPFMQVGRKVIFDADKVLAALEQNPKSRK